MALLPSVFKALNPRAVRAYEGLPGPAPSLPLGNLPDFLGRQTWDVCSDYSARHGGAAVAWLGTRPVVCVGGEETLTHVLFDGREAFQELHPSRAFAPDENAPWRQDSSLHILNGPAAKGWLDERIVGMAAPMAERARALAEETAQGSNGQRGKSMRLMPPLRRVTFDLLAQALVGRELGTRAFEDLDFLARKSSRRLMPTTQLRAHKDQATIAAAERWNTSWAACLSEAERFPGEGPGGLQGDRTDLLGRLLQSGSPLDRSLWTRALSELCIDVAFLVPSMVATALHLLGTDPIWAERLRRSLADLPENPTPEELAANVPLDAVLRESLRLWSPAPLERRQAKPGAGLAASGPPLPGDAELLCSSWGQRSDEQRWGSNPTEFRPERWDNKLRQRYPIGSRGFIPLGAGRRTWSCADLACAMARSFLVQWTRAARFTPAPRQIPSAGETSLMGVRMPMGIRAQVNRI